jgi:hypothetical protein
MLHLLPCSKHNGLVVHHTEETHHVSTKNHGHAGSNGP